MPTIKTGQVPTGQHGIYSIQISQNDAITALKEGKSITKLLAEREIEMGVDNQYQGDVAKLDAFQRKLLSLGLTAKSEFAGLMTQPEATLIFPEIVQRAELMTSAKLNPNEVTPEQLIGFRREVDSNTIKPTRVEFKNNISYKRVTERTKFPTATLTTSEDVVNMYKFGFAVDVTDEVLRRQSIDQVSYIMQQSILRYRIRWQVAEIIDLILDATESKRQTYEGDLNWRKLNRFLMLSRGYERSLLISTQLGNAEGVISCEEIINMLADPRSSDYEKTGIWPKFLGKKMVYYDQADEGSDWDPDTDEFSDRVLDEKMISIHTAGAIGLYMEKGSDTRETARFIHGQVNEYDHSFVAGFNVEDKDRVDILEPAP